MSNKCRVCGRQLPRDRIGIEQKCAFCKVFKICKLCKKEFKISKTTANQEYCSERCWEKTHGLK